MGNKNFHDKPYDAGTLGKLRVFELYAQEWIPVFLSRAEPPFNEVHLFDFFCGPGTDPIGVPGPPRRVPAQLRAYHEKGLAGWNKVRIAVHLFDQDPEKVASLKSIHRAAVDYYRKLIPSGDKLFLGAFSIRKRSNIYGLIFGSHHPLGIHKFLQVAWATDEVAGEANFDIDRENIRPEEGILPFEMMRPNKIRNFELEFEAALRSGNIRSELDAVRFCIEAGMTCRHSAPVLKKLREEGVIEMDFRVPDVGRLKSPRSIRLTQ